MVSATGLQLPGGERDLVVGPLAAQGPDDSLAAAVHPVLASGSANILERQGLELTPESRPQHRSAIVIEAGWRGPWARTSRPQRQARPCRYQRTSVAGDTRCRQSFQPTCTARSSS